MVDRTLHTPPPQALDLEEMALAAAMMGKNDALIAIDKLTMDDFFHERHQLIFGAICDLANNGHGIDLRSVYATLVKKNQAELAGGAVYLAEITSKLSSSANLEYYCLILKEHTIKRKLIHLGMTLTTMGYRDDQDAFELMDVVRRELLFLDTNITGTAKEQHIKDGLYKLTMHLQERAKLDKPPLTGVPSGFEPIDRITQGWQNTDLIILAGRPGMAKSSLAIACAHNSAVDFGVPTAVFSLEMSTPQLVNKLASIATEIDLKILRGEKLTDLEWGRFNNRIAKLAGAPLFIDDSPSLSVLEFRSRCRRLKDTYKIGLIIVDYLQLMKGERHNRGNREEEISSITRTLKHVAKELNVPIIALSQLSREVEKRKGQMKPQLSDLRESGAIEQDADLVGFIWRPEYYKIELDSDGMPYLPGYTEIHFAKHRNGAPGTAALQFISRLTGFRVIEKPAMVQVGAMLPTPATETAPPTAYPDTSGDAPF